MKVEAKKLEKKVADKDMKSSGMIKVVKDDLKYESRIKKEEAKLKRDEIYEFQEETKQRQGDKQKAVIEKQVEMQR